MKRKFIYALVAGVCMLGILSFTLIKNKVATDKVIKKVKVVKAPCTGNIVNPVSVSWTPGSITITWSTTGTYDHFNYGGYGVVTPGSTTSNSKSYSFTGTSASRFGVVCACADGSTSGQTHGVLFSSSGYSLF